MSDDLVIECADGPWTFPARFYCLPEEATSLGAKMTGPRREYIRADLARALVAEAYETCAKIADERTPDRPLWKRATGWAIAQAIRALTPAGAVAAREARDKQVREQALREAAEAVRDENERRLALASVRVPALADELIPAILALIEKDKTNE